MPPLPATLADQSPGADEARASVSNLVQKFEAERRKKAFLAQKAFSSSDALGSPSAVALGEDVSPYFRAALDDNHLHLGHRNGPSPLSGSVNRQHDAHEPTGSRNGGVAQPPQPLKRIDTATAAGLGGAGGLGTSTVTPSSSSSAFASAISARAAELRHRGATVATPSITPGRVDAAADPAADPLPLFKKVNGRWVETPASVAYFQSHGTLEAPDVGGDDDAEVVTAAAVAGATCGTDSQKHSGLQGNDGENDGYKPQLEPGAGPWASAAAHGAQNPAMQTDSQAEPGHKAPSADTTAVTRPYGLRPAPMTLSVKMPSLTGGKGLTTTAARATASTGAEVPSPCSDCGDRPASAAPPSSAGTASSLQSVLLSAGSSGGGGSSAAYSSGRGLLRITEVTLTDERPDRGSSQYTAPSASTSWAPVSGAEWNVSEHGGGPRMAEGEALKDRGVMSRLEELMRTAAELEGGDGLDESPICAAGGWWDDEDCWSQGDLGDRVDDGDSESDSDDDGGVSDSVVESEGLLVAGEPRALAPAPTRNPATPWEWNTGPVTTAAPAAQSRDNRNISRKGSKQDLGYVGREPSLEKVGAISGILFRLLVSQGMLYALSAKDGTIIHPKFPIDLERILSAVPLQRRVVVVFLSVSGASGRPKTEVSLMDVEIDFQSDSLATQWAATLDAAASKGNVSGVTGKQAIVLVDQQDKKVVSDVLKKQVIPILNLARKPFDIIPVEFSQACIEEALRSLPMEKVNAVACITTRKSSLSNVEDILLRVARGLGLPQDSIRVGASPKDAVELSMAMVKEPLQYSELCLFSAVVRHDRRGLKTKMKHSSLAL